MDELKKRIENGRASENKKPKKSRKSKKGLTLKQRREEEKHLQAMHKRGQEVTGEMELMMELKKQESSSPLYNHSPSNSPYHPSNSPPYHPSNSPLDPSPYFANGTNAENNKRLSDARDFNELQRKKKLQKKRNMVQAELADLGSLQVMFAEDARANAKLATPAELERLTAVYPERVYGKEAEKIWNEKFGYKPNAPKRPQPSVRKTKKNAPRTNGPRRPQPSIRKTNGPRTNAPRRPQPVTRKVTQAAPVAQAAPKMKSKPVPRGNRRRKQTG